MHIASIPLPCCLKPSILNLTKAIDSSHLVIAEDGKTINIIHANLFSGETSISSTIHGLDYDVIPYTSIYIVLLDKCLLVQEKEKEYTIPLNYEATRISISCYKNKAYYIFVYGSTTIEIIAFHIDNGYDTLQPICLSSRCHLLSYSHSILFTALMDGTFSYWKLNDNQEWQLLGSELFNTYRITDICCDEFPQIVIATWEGTLYIKKIIEEKQFYLNTIQTIDTKPIIQPGECCGTFIQYLEFDNTYVVSRAVSKEIIIYNKDFSKVLVNIHLPTFLRGLIVLGRSSSIIVGFTNNSFYCFPYSFKYYYDQTPLITHSFDDITVYRTLSWFGIYPNEKSSFSNYEIINHTLKIKESEKIIVFQKRILAYREMRSNCILLGFTDKFIVFDANEMICLYKIPITVPDIIEMSIGGLTHYDFLIMINHVKDEMVVPSCARFQYKDPNHKIVITETPIFHQIAKDDINENEIQDYQSMRKQIDSVLNIQY